MLIHYSGKDETERVILLDDFPTRRRGEMRADDERAIRIALTKFPPRLLCARAIDVENVVPLGVTALNRVMHQIAGDNRVLSLGGNSNREMAGCVTGSGFAPDLIGDLVLIVDQLAHPFRQYRTHRVDDL